MTEVSRFLSELTALFDSNPAGDDLKLHAHLRLSSFIGRVVVRERGYAPPEDIVPVLSEARAALQKIAVQGNARLVRMELLAELDKAIAAAAPPRSAAPKSQ